MRKMAYLLSNWFMALNPNRVIKMHLVADALTKYHLKESLIL
jgi:hypothetical protein